MAVKKSKFYSPLWNGCNELRGGMDASSYKDYVLTLLFVKYVTDRFASDHYAEVEVEIPESDSFLDIIIAKRKSDISDKVNKIINKLAESNRLSGVIDIVDFVDDGKLGTRNLQRLPKKWIIDSAVYHEIIEVKSANNHEIINLLKEEIHAID